MPSIPVYKLLSSKLHCSFLRFMLLRNNSSLTLHPIKHSIKSATTDTCPRWEETKLWSQALLAVLRTPTCKASLIFKTGKVPRCAGGCGGVLYSSDLTLHPLNASAATEAAGPNHEHRR